MKASNAAIDVLANSRTDGNILYLPPQQLDRPLYMAVNKALEALGGKWNRKEKGHIFPDDPSGAIEQLLQTGEYISAKVEYQFFETPEWLAVKMVELACVREGEWVLEPSAGRGAIARHIPGCDCVELNPDNRRYLEENGFNVVGEDFLAFNQPYDAIIMNPPFTRQQDVDHITHAITLAGRVVIAIASASVLFRTNRKTEEFREMVWGYGGTIEPLPEGTFKESGTAVNTCLVVVEK